MRKATQKEIERFVTYRANHVALVQRIGKLVFDIDLSDHDHDKIECSGEDLNLWSLRNLMQDDEYHPNKGDRRILNRISAIHKKTQPHHPEYWDDNVTVEDIIEDDKQIVATKMSKKALLAMICDWASVAIKLNQPLFKFYNSVVESENPKYVFTDNQKKFIVEGILQIEKNIDKDKLYWLGKKYTAKQVDPLGVVSLTERVSKKLKVLEESILDVPQKEYCKELLTSDDKMKPEVRDQILNTVKNWQSQINFDFEVKKVYAKGSLLSKRYNDTSDLDVSIYTNMSKEQLDSVYDIIPKGQNIEGTEHSLDFFVLIEGEDTPEKNLDNIYDVLNDKWVKRTSEYENEIPLDYVVQVSNFFINGARIALSNYENDKILYEYYNDLDSQNYEISEEELNSTRELKKKDLMADLDALKIALHMISSFRQEVYEEENPQAFNISIETASDNPHVSINEQLAKTLEKFGIRQALRDAVDACEALINEGENALKEEVASSAFAGMVPENNLRMIKLNMTAVKDLEKEKGENLKESKNLTAAMCFGRYNPPTIGHLKLWQVLGHVDADTRLLYTSHTRDNKKNPLDYSTKAALIEACIEEHNINVAFVDTEARTFIDVVVDVYNKGYNNLIIVAGSDRLEELVDLAKKYNDVPNRAGEAYHFDNIEGRSAGQRDPDSENVEGISGTKMRQFVKDNDFEAFSKYCPVTDKNIVEDVWKELRAILA